jgi:glycosyltransferase 2 family protein
MSGGGGSPTRLLAGAAAASAAIGWSAARARRGTVSPAEARVFHAVNDAPDVLHPVVWPVMQAGSLGAVFVVAGAVGRRSGRRGAMVVAGVGTAVWGGVKLVKPAVGRGRPAAHLSDVHVRGPEQTGLGYPSGHAAVSLSLALVAPTRCGWLRAGLALAGLTGLARMYVGAHLPLDVLGGYGVGVLAGCATTVATNVTRKPA